MKTLKPKIKTPTQMEIENRLLADAMQFLQSSTGRRVQLTSLRPGDRLESIDGERRTVLQNPRALRVVEVNSDCNQPDVRSYQQVIVGFDRVTRLAKLPFFLRMYARFLVWRANK